MVAYVFVFLCVLMCVPAVCVFKDASLQAMCVYVMVYRLKLT